MTRIVSKIYLKCPNKEKRRLYRRFLIGSCITLFIKAKAHKLPLWSAIRTPGEVSQQSTNSISLSGRLLLPHLNASPCARGGGTAKRSDCVGGIVATKAPKPPM